MVRTKRNSNFNKRNYSKKSKINNYTALGGGNGDGSYEDKKLDDALAIPDIKQIIEAINNGKKRKIGLLISDSIFGDDGTRGTNINKKNIMETLKNLLEIATRKDNPNEIKAALYILRHGGIKNEIFNKDSGLARDVVESKFGENNKLSRVNEYLINEVYNDPNVNDENTMNNTVDSLLDPAADKVQNAADAMKVAEAEYNKVRVSTDATPQDKAKKQRKFFEIQDEYNLALIENSLPPPADPKNGWSEQEAKDLADKGNKDLLRFLLDREAYDKQKIRMDNYVKRATQMRSEGKTVEDAINDIKLENVEPGVLLEAGFDEEEVNNAFAKSQRQEDTVESEKEPINEISSDLPKKRYGLFMKSDKSTAKSQSVSPKESQSFFSRKKKNKSDKESLIPSEKKIDYPIMRVYGRMIATLGTFIKGTIPFLCFLLCIGGPPFTVAAIGTTAGVYGIYGTFQLIKSIYTKNFRRKAIIMSYKHILTSIFEQLNLEDGDSRNKKTKIEILFKHFGVFQTLGKRIAESQVGFTKVNYSSLFSKEVEQIATIKLFFDILKKKFIKAKKITKKEKKKQKLENIHKLLHPLKLVAQQKILIIQNKKENDEAKLDKAEEIKLDSCLKILDSLISTEKKKNTIQYLLEQLSIDNDYREEFISKQQEMESNEDLLDLAAHDDILEFMELKIREDNPFDRKLKQINSEGDVQNFILSLRSEKKTSKQNDNQVSQEQLPQLSLSSQPTSEPSTLRPTPEPSTLRPTSEPSTPSIPSTSSRTSGLLDLAMRKALLIVLSDQTNKDYIKNEIDNIKNIGDVYTILFEKLIKTYNFEDYINTSGNEDEIDNIEEFKNKINGNHSVVQESILADLEKYVGKKNFSFFNTMDKAEQQGEIIDHGYSNGIKYDADKILPFNKGFKIKYYQKEKIFVTPEKFESLTKSDKQREAREQAFKKTMEKIRSKTGGTLISTNYFSSDDDESINESLINESLDNESSDNESINEYNDEQLGGNKTLNKYISRKSSDRNFSIEEIKKFFEYFIIITYDLRECIGLLLNDTAIEVKNLSQPKNKSDTDYDNGILNMFFRLYMNKLVGKKEKNLDDVEVNETNKGGIIEDTSNYIINPSFIDEKISSISIYKDIAIKLIGKNKESYKRSILYIKLSSILDRITTEGSSINIKSIIFHQNIPQFVEFIINNLFFIDINEYTGGEGFDNKFEKELRKIFDPNKASNENEMDKRTLILLSNIFLQDNNMKTINEFKKKVKIIDNIIDESSGINKTQIKKIFNKINSKVFNKDFISFDISNPLKINIDLKVFGPEFGDEVQNDDETNSENTELLKKIMDDTGLDEDELIDALESLKTNGAPSTSELEEQIQSEQAPSGAPSAAQASEAGAAQAPEAGATQAPAPSPTTQGSSMFGNLFSGFGR